MFHPLVTCTILTMAILRPHELLHEGLRHVGCSERLLSRNVPYRKKVERYKACFGQLPYVHAVVWAKMKRFDNERRMDRFYMLLFFYKVYDTEAVLAVRFDIDEDTVRLWLWYYAEALAILKDEVIFMPDSFPEEIKFPLVVDGTHCTMFRQKHDMYPVDTAYYGHKRKTDSLNYQVALSTFESKLYRMDGPYPAGAYSDATVFVESGLQKQMLSQGKRAIADGGYENIKGAASPNRKYHSKRTNLYFRRNRARVERVMGYFKNYAILSSTFRVKKDRERLHQVVFDGISVLVQTAMQTKNPVFSV